MKIWETVKEFVEKHLVLSWAIITIVVAIVIHWLFKTPAPCEFLDADWESGDILTFVSTVALGLLAVWQNKKFKEENDLSQKRIEKLTLQANELSVVSKIIEHESERLTRLRKKQQDYIEACNTEEMLIDISGISNQPSDFRKIYIDIMLDARNKRIQLTTIELLTELGFYRKEEIATLLDIITAYSKFSLDLISKVRASVADDDIYNKKKEKEHEFFDEMREFIWKREDALNKVIYGNLGLDEIKARYYTELYEEGDN